MGKVINGEHKRIGLALSGGGFRAAMYHLGVIRQLADWGTLWDVDVMSSVSGGSITGAFIALNWGDEKAFDHLQHYLSSYTETPGSFIGGIVNPFETRTHALAKAFDRNLFGGATFADIDAAPRSYIGTANLATGNFFTFAGGGDTAPNMGDYELGFQEHKAGEFKIADAVAASCAFSPVFPPLRVDRDIFHSELDYVTLTDGGFYDILAVTPLVNQLSNLDYVIVSDGSKPFDTHHSPTESGVVTIHRTLEILGKQVRRLQFDRLLSKYQAKRGPKPVWFSIDSPVGAANTVDPVICSSIPSDFRELQYELCFILQRHSSSLLTHRVKQYAPELIE